MVPSPVVKSVPDVLALVRGAMLFTTDEKRKGGHQPEQVAINCALLSTAFVYFDLEREGFQTLQAQTDYVVNFFQGKLTGPVAERHPQLFFNVPQREVDQESQAGTPLTIVAIPGTASLHARGKRRRRAAGKLMRDPGASEQTALKDAIGIRIELKRKSVASAMVQIAPYLTRYLGARNIEIEDRNMLSRGDFDDMRTKLQGTLMTEFTLERVENDTGYRVLKISADVLVPADPQDPDPSARKIYRRMEFQIVDTENKNEAGFKNHHFYELAQTIEESTRLLGGISEARLRRLAVDVSAKGGPEPDAVIEELVRTGTIFKLPDTKQKYASVVQWARWLRVKDEKGHLLIPDGIRKMIEGRIPPEALRVAFEQTKDEEPQNEF
jgi:hypothetical protein